MAGSSKGAAAQGLDGGPSGSDQPGQSVVPCKAAKPVPAKSQTVEPFITVTPPSHWYETSGASAKQQTGKIKLSAKRRDDELGYDKAGSFTATGDSVKFYSDSACSQQITPETGPVPYSFAALKAGVTVYYRGNVTGATNLSLSLGAAGDARINVQGPVAGQVDVPLRPELSIAIAAPKIIIVSYDYHGKTKPGVKRHRVPIVLGVTNPSGGEGVLSCNRASGSVSTNDVALFTSEEGGSKLSLPLKVPVGELAATKTVWAEGLNPSNAVNGTEFALTLRHSTVGPEPGKEEVKDTLTCVRLRLDIFKSRPEDDSEPIKLDRGKRIAPGRYLLEQGATPETLFAERARLAVAQAEPVDYTGKVLVKALIANLSFFAADKEKPEDGQPVLQAADLNWPNATIDVNDGKRFWLEGKTRSAALDDTGVAVYLEDVPDVEGDRITMTVLKAELKLHKSRVSRDADPTEFADADKVDKGRYLHVQDAKFQHGRARITVCKVVPDGFDGTLVLSGWNITKSPYDGTRSVSPKVKPFKREKPSSGQSAVTLPHEIRHASSFDAKGKAFWVEGGTVSGDLLDTQLRLGVKEADKGCDRVSFNVIHFKNLKAVVPSTPPNTARGNGTGGNNGPVTEHTFDAVKGALDGKDYSEDSKKNEPLVLIEGSVVGGSPIQLSVEVAPAGKNIPVLWSVQRDKRKGEGDHDQIIGLAGNSNDPGLTAAGDVLKATLTTAGVGTFHIRPYVDCNDNAAFDHNNDAGKRIDREPFILLNLVLVRAEGITNLTVANAAAGTGMTTQASGAPRGFSSGDFKGKGNDALDMNATVRVIGGGQDGKRGLDRVFAGWANNERDSGTSPGPGGLGEDVTHYFAQLPAPGIGQPLPALERLRCFWQLAGAEVGGPVLDSGYAGQGTGGHSCCGTMGANQDNGKVKKSRHSSGIGQIWQAKNSDSPGGGITSLSAGGAQLTRFTFNIDFRCDLVFWTSFAKNQGPADSPACRLYSSVFSNTWGIRFDAAFTPAWVATMNAAKNVVLVAGAAGRAQRVEGNGLETRLPDGLTLLQADIAF